MLALMAVIFTFVDHDKLHHVVSSSIKQKVFACIPDGSGGCSGAGGGFKPSFGVGWSTTADVCERSNDGASIAKMITLTDKA